MILAVATQLRSRIYRRLFRFKVNCYLPDQEYRYLTAIDRSTKRNNHAQLIALTQKHPKSLALT